MLFFQPVFSYYLLIYPVCAAKCINFLGMHPTFIQVPPSPHFVPYGDGFTKSASPTFAPASAAYFAAESPPDPPPITKRSYS